MKEKLAKFGTKALDVLVDVLDGDGAKFVIAAAISVASVNYIYKRGVRDAAEMIGSMIEVGNKLDSE